MFLCLLNAQLIKKVKNERQHQDYDCLVYQRVLRTISKRIFVVSARYADLKADFKSEWYHLK